MSAVRPLRRLRVPSPLSSSTVQCSAARTFHASSYVSQQRQPPRDGPKQNGAKPPVNPLTAPYTADQIRELKELYTPEQFAALLAGEAAIDRADFERKKERDGWDMFKMPYVDDFTQYHPLLDFPPKDPLNADAEIDAVDQPIPKMYDPSLTFEGEAVEGETNYALLAKLTGYDEKQLKNFIVRPLWEHRVMNQTRLGKIQKHYFLTVAGNGNGWIGVGEGKSAEPADAMQISKVNAIRSMKPIPRYESRTIFGNMAVKNGAVEMELFTRPPGFGVRCSQYIFEMCRVAGIHDLSVRVTRSRNPMNVVKTFEYALHRQKLPETIARGRGLKLVDVRKVYYGGNN